MGWRPGSPPDLRGALTGCPFQPRCAFATDACATVDMSLQATEPDHVTACPFVNAAQAETASFSGLPLFAPFFAMVIPLSAGELSRQSPGEYSAQSSVLRQSE